MCLDPVSMIGMGLSLAGSMAQASSQAAYVNAQNKANRDAYEISKKAREAELVRQKQFEDEAAGYWNDTADALGSEDFSTDKDAATNQFMDTFDQMSSAIGEGELLSGQQFASDEVKTEIAARANKAAVDARKRVQALAALTGGDNAFMGRSFNLNDTANTLSTLNTLRRGSLGVSNQEQNIAPAQVSQGSSIFGDVLSGVGGMVTQKGAYNSTVNG